MFDQLEVTKYHTGKYSIASPSPPLCNYQSIPRKRPLTHAGLVVFVEEDHYVAEDFLYILELMQLKSNELCSKCNILSLGTYLKTFNYYTYNKKVSVLSFSLNCALLVFQTPNKKFL